MRKSKFIVIIVSFLFSGFLATAYEPAVNDENSSRISIIPKPARLEELPGEFAITTGFRILVPDGNTEAMEVAEFLARRLRTATGFRVPVEAGGADAGTGKPTLTMLLVAEKELGGEGYELTVSPDGMELNAAAPAGLFYGVQTILQMLPPDVFLDKEVPPGTEWAAPCAKILDYPRFPYRGMHLDVSRHFFPKEFVERYIDLIALHKMNTFHWHLTDDNGWRLEIERYPKLAEIGAWRVDRESEPWNYWSPIREGEEATYGCYYTQDEVREIIEYARRRHVTIIPEIEMPGHSREVLAAYPEYSCTGGPFTVAPGGYWPNIDILCAGKEGTFEFLENVLDEVIDLFPSQYIHIGGDEADKTNWRACPDCQARIEAEGLAGEGELQSYFIKRIEQFLLSKGRRLIGWDEILEGGLAPEATVMSWRGTAGGIEAARQGHDVIMTPTSHCYFDYYQADPEFQPKAIGGFTTTKEVYAFEPLPPELTPDEAKHILGAQGNVWTEYIKTPAHAEYMSVPRLTALAEVVWSPEEGKDWPDFRQRLERHFRRLGALGVNYSTGSFAVEVRTVFADDGLAVALETEQLDPEIRYTLDGRLPGGESPVYKSPIPLTHTTHVRAAIFRDGVSMERPADRVVLLHEATGKPLALKSACSRHYTGGGDRALVDGLQGTNDHGDGCWQGFEGDDLEAVIDLLEATDLQNVSVRFLQNRNALIYLPADVEVSLSDDGEEFRPPAILVNDVPQNREGAFTRAFAMSLAGERARFIRVRATNAGVDPHLQGAEGLKAWLFADEIVVR